MRHSFSIFVLLVISFGSLATTKQVVDILITGSDTICLRDSPLERLMLKYRPFGHTRDSVPSSACRRGYTAVWRMENNKLYLEKIIRCNTDELQGEENIIALFQKNGLTFQTKDQMILADWYTQDLYRMKQPGKYICLSAIRGEYATEQDVFLRIEKGHITKTRLIT